MRLHALRRWAPVEIGGALDTLMLQALCAIVIPSAMRLRELGRRALVEIRAPCAPRSFVRCVPKWFQTPRSSMASGAGRQLRSVRRARRAPGFLALCATTGSGALCLCEPGHRAQIEISAFPDLCSNTGPGCLRLHELVRCAPIAVRIT